MPFEGAEIIGEYDGVGSTTRNHEQLSEVARDTNVSSETYGRMSCSSGSVTGCGPALTGASPFHRAEEWSFAIR